MELNSLAAEQRRRNRLSRDAWEAYQPHRRRVTSLLENAAQGRDVPRLCVLGAGNANDVDLAVLANCFGEIHLVDVDLESLQFAQMRLPESLAERITLHGGIDVAGLLSQSPAGDESRERETDESLIAALQAPPRLNLPGPFDVVASTGLLTQLFDEAARRWGPSDPPFLDAITAIRRAHLRLLVDLVVPGGVALLVVEIVSSDTFPELRSLPEEALASAVGAQINQRNFFTGANPAAIKAQLESEDFQAEVARIEVTLPWVWQFVERDYAVYAVVITRR